jgi:putative membrane protein
MKKVFIALLALSTCAGLNACNDSGNATDAKDVADSANEQKFDSSRIEGDADWAVDAAAGGMMEVKFGELAQKNAGSAQVRDFGKTMVTDHSKANDELKALAAQKNISLPATLSDEAQRKYDDLAKKTGADFDKDYMSMMVDDHEEDIDEFKKEAADGRDAELKTWAADKIQVLQHHLDMAKQIRDGLK